MSRKEIDWEQLRREYAEGASCHDLGEKYGLDYSGIAKRAKKEGWKQDREQIVHETATKTVRARARAYARTGESRAARLRKTEEAAEKLAGILDRVCSQLEKVDFQSVNEKQMNGLRSLATALKVNGDQLMTLYGLMDPYKEQQIKIASEKLQMEKQAAEAESTTETWRMEISDLEEQHADDTVQAQQETAEGV